MKKTGKANEKRKRGKVRSKRWGSEWTRGKGGRGAQAPRWAQMSSSNPLFHNIVTMHKLHLLWTNFWQLVHRYYRLLLTNTTVAFTYLSFLLNLFWHNHILPRFTQSVVSTYQL